MVQQIINIGSAANDGTGDPLRTAFSKINQNFTEVYGKDAAGANFDFTDNTLSSTNTNGNIELNPNGTGQVVVYANIVATGDIITSGKMQGDGGLLTNIAATSGTYINNGTSNVVVEPSGNVEISVGGVANALVVSTTGTVLNGSLGTGLAVITIGNITTINSGLMQNGNSNVAITANGNITFTSTGNATLVVTGTGANISGTANVSGNANVGNLGTAGSITATGNITAGNLVATGDIQINGNDIRSSTGNAAITLSDKDVTVRGNLAVQGLTTTIGSENYSVTDSIINLHTFSNLAPLTADDGRDIGIKMHYFKSSTDKHAFVGWANDTGFLEYYSDATESGGGVISGTYGTFKVANVFLTDGVVYNGNSNVTINANSDVTISVAGNANVVTVTGSGANITGQVSASANITAPQLISNVATGTAPFVVTSTTQVANLNVATAGSALTATTAGTVTTAAQPNITSLGTLNSVTVAGGSTSVAPINLTSGTNLTSATAGAFEYDGTTLNFTPSTSYGRAAVPTMIYTSGAGTSLSTGSEATAQPLFPGAGDTITLPVGTYFITLVALITRGGTSTTTATARINLAGGGTAVGTFSGQATSSIAAGGAGNVFTFPNTALTVDNVVTATNAAAGGVYNINMSGILRITTSGTFTPKYSLSVNISAATATAPSSLNFMTVQSIATSGSAAATGGWA